MGLALDEPKTNDEKLEAEGFSFIIYHDFRSDGYNSIIWKPPYRLHGTSMDERIPIVLFRKSFLLIPWQAVEVIARDILKIILRLKVYHFTRSGLRCF